MRCAVPECSSNNLQRIHRFPESKYVVHKWKESLQLKEFPIELLQTRFGVCSLHFRDDDFEDLDHDIRKENKKILKQNAIPKLRTQRTNLSLTSLATNKNGDSKTHICAPPSNVSTTLLEEPSSSKPCIMEFSTLSTEGNDISILKTHDSHYGDPYSDKDEDSEAECTERCKQTHATIDSSDFEILHEQNFFHTIRPSSRNGYSGTDSDIEVLMSEEIHHTEWSAALENLENNTFEEEVIRSMNSELVEYMKRTPPVPHKELTDQERLVHEQRLQSSLDCLDGLNTDQLINTIREQRVRIRELESSLNRIRNTQDSFFNFVDAMRQELAAAIKFEKTRTVLD